MVKALFRWATKKSYLPRSPAADSDVLKRGKHAQRHRRLEPGEEEKLLAHAGDHALSAASRESLRAIDLTFHTSGMRADRGSSSHGARRRRSHARAREHGADVDLLERAEGRIAGRDEAARRLPLLSRCKRRGHDRAPLRNDGKPGAVQPLIN